MKSDMQKNGISLIVLVITIVIMIILAGAVILTLVNSGIISQTRMGIFKNNVANYKTELQHYVANATIEGTVNVYGERTSFKVEEFSRDENLIKEYIKSMSNKDAERFLIIQGELAYILDNALFTKDEIIALNEIGIRPTEYTYEENIGVFVAGTDYSGQKLYVNPRPEKPTANFMYTLRYVSDNDYSVLGYDPETMGVEIIVFMYKEEMYQYIAPGAIVPREEMQGAIVNGKRMEATGPENVTFKYGGWNKVTFVEDNVIVYTILPENLPQVIANNAFSYADGLENYVSLEPYVPVI